MNIFIAIMIEMTYLQIKDSNREGKKYVAFFYNNDKKKVKTIHFGSAGMSDYTIHKDDERKQRYLDRHRANENWDNPMTAGSLSKHLLWTHKNFDKAVKEFVKLFNLKLIQNGNIVQSK